MPHFRHRTGIPLAVLAAACVMASPRAEAMAGQNGQRTAPAPAGQGTVVVEQVENGPAFGVEFKYAQVGHDDAYLLGGYGGYLFDHTFFIGGAGYWQLNNSHYRYYGDEYYYDPGYAGCYYGCGHYYSPYDVNAYGGLLLEWYALRSPAVALSARGLIGGGVATVGWTGYPQPYQPDGRHGPAEAPVAGYYVYDQAYFVFEPQVNVTLRIAPHLAMVGGVGYRVIGAANGFEDQIQGLTGTFAIRFGGGR
jgi:hypothetical protein